MATATVKTVQFLDPRIEPQPDPVYDYVIAPIQNQFYTINASSVSNSYIAFNNLTTLGTERAYLDTAEVEYEVLITFKPATGLTDAQITDFLTNHGPMIAPGEWTFEAFPMSHVTEEIRVNINGGTMFSQPLSYMRPKMHYMNQYDLARSYANICPITRPVSQYEGCKEYWGANSTTQSARDAQIALLDFEPAVSGIAYGAGDTAAGLANQVHACPKPRKPTRLFGGLGFPPFEGMNNSNILAAGKAKTAGGFPYGFDNYHVDADGKIVVTARWREPLACSPFSSKYDAEYGRPLYNITSLDIALNITKPENMIRIAHLAHNRFNIAGGTTAVDIGDYSVEIKSATLCYQVMTIPPIVQKPTTTLCSYRRFVPYITDYKPTTALPDSTPTSALMQKLQDRSILRFVSGQYTFNEIPNAIWAYVSVDKADMQDNKPDKRYNGESGESEDTSTNGCTSLNDFSCNRQFAFITRVDISMANTTQMLTTAKPYDLYRIAKANGCDDSYEKFACFDRIEPSIPVIPRDLSTRQNMNTNIVKGPYDHVNPTPRLKEEGTGSVLRLKPGVDLIVPDQPLIPGANAYNMVFQASVDAVLPHRSKSHTTWVLWLLFEYAGVIAISPGQCEVTMNPLGSGEVMGMSPIMSATSNETEGSLDGSGFWDSLSKAARIAGTVGDQNNVNRLLKQLPGSAATAAWADAHGLSAPGPAMKRPRNGDSSGGAVMGKGYKDWV